MASLSRQGSSCRSNAGEPTTIARPLAAPLDCLITFIVRRYVPEPNHRLFRGIGDDPPPRVCGAWVEVLPDLVANSVNPALPAAISAFALALLSGGPDKSGSILSGHEAYSLALRSLRLELRTTPKNGSLPSELAAAIMCLLLAELFLPTSLDSWTAHLQGFAELMQLAHPELYTVGIPHKLFVGARPILVGFSGLSTLSSSG